jgi:hypothetical protein
MLTDTYTKIVLTIIAVMLTIIGCKTVVTPERTVHAEGLFSGVQAINEQTFFDTRSGEIWQFNRYVQKGQGHMRLLGHYRLVKLGDEMTMEELKEPQLPGR